MKLTKAGLAMLSLLLLGACSQNGNSSSQPNASSQETSSSAKDSSLDSISSREESSSTEEETLELDEELLNQLASAYDITSTIIFTQDDTTQTFVGRAQFYSQKLSIQYYRNNELDSFETYIKGDDNKVFATRRNVNNGITIYKQYAADGSRQYDWYQDGYDNIFSNLTLSDFLDEGNNTYSLDLEQSDIDNNFQSIINQLLFKDSLAELSSFKLKIDENDDLLLETTTKEFTANGHTYSYSSTSRITEYGTLSEIIDRAKPYTFEDDEDFETAMASLRNGNYTLTHEEYSSETLLSTSVLYSASDRILYTAVNPDGSGSNVTAGFYQTEEGMYQEIYQSGDTLYRTGEPGSMSLDEVRPTFNISSKVFEKENSIYSLREDVTGDLSIVSNFASNVDELINFTFEIKDGSYVFTNASKDNSKKAVITITNIGSTTPFHVEDVKDNVAKTWSELLDTATYQKMQTVMTSEIASKLPVPLDCYTENAWVDFYAEDGDESDPSTLLLVYGDENKTITDSELASYALQLSTAGFEQQNEEADEEGGYSFYYNNTVSVWIANYYGMFAMMITTL